MKPLLSRFRREHKQLALLVAGYTLVFFTLAWRRYSVFGWDTGDFGNFNDMFWWTFRGRPFYFPGREMSNFGLHAAFLWVQLLPVYWLAPGVPTLIFMQSLFLGLTAVPVYLIARKCFDDHPTALVLAAAFLLFPPIVSQNVNQVEEPSFLAVYLLFAFYFFLQQRFGWFMLFALIACLGRENVPLAVAMFGVYAALLRRPKRWIFAPLLMGGVYFVIVTFVVMPWFRQGVPWDPTSRMFTYLGDTPGAIVRAALTNPGRVLAHVLSEENLRYMVLLAQPLGWVLPLFSGASLMALPDLAINTVSDNSALKVIPWHYNVITGSALFVGAILSARTLTGWLRAKYGDAPYHRVVAVALLLLIVAHWYLWFSPQQYRRLPHHDSLVRAIRLVPPDKSVIVPAHLQGHVSGRERWHVLSAFLERPEWAAQFEYVIMDANDRRFAPVVTREFFDQFYQHPHYQLVFAENNVFVFQRLGGESDWSISLH
jgi:uncharacterized membrane protein